MKPSKALTFQEFLGSDTVELYTPTSSESWKIHRKLVVSKCKALESAFTQDFSERTSGQYTFKETTHDTVARFIEWTYRGDYSEDELTPMDVPHAEKPDPKSPQSGLTSDENKTLQAHTPLCHLRVYIFSDTYLVSELKDLSFEKFTAVVRDIGRPKNLDEQLAAIDCLSLAFSKLPLHDKLPAWLAQYAAWCLENLRLQTKFHELLQAIPSLSYRMMDTLNPAKEAPWDVKPFKYRVPSYDASGLFEDNDY